MISGLITRDQWQAERALWATFLLPPAIYVFSTFDTHVSPCFSEKKCLRDVKFLQKEAMRSGKVPDIKYNFLITAHGKIIEGRGWIYCPGVPTKYRNFLQRSIYIGFMGNFTRDDPPRTMYYARDRIIEFGLKNDYISQKVLEFVLKKN
ncbi:peptidoglycan-recognition protein SB1-like [Macrosteles quadrilineatus]|uniref:peptidoglycan-recognition protein SB1-like n=1 Tax=Macrosteles quadrilineatus TaxID=74068 RepID=UPI0023E2DD3A|nr:peptidoglycan-recognition protein SB1-like [Macrosteles quadrilineatus]